MRRPKLRSGSFSSPSRSPLPEAGGVPSGEGELGVHPIRLSGSLITLQYATMNGLNATGAHHSCTPCGASCPDPPSPSKNRSRDRTGRKLNTNVSGWAKADVPACHSSRRQAVGAPFDGGGQFDTSASAPQPNGKPGVNRRNAERRCDVAGHAKSDASQRQTHPGLVRASSEGSGRRRRNSSQKRQRLSPPAHRKVYQNRTGCLAEDEIRHWPYSATITSWNAVKPKRCGNLLNTPV